MFRCGHMLMRTDERIQRGASYNKARGRLLSQAPVTAHQTFVLTAQRRPIPPEPW